MGSNASKPVETNENKVSIETPPPPPQVNVAADASAADASNTTNSIIKESKCPMHRADGTYSFDWRALFQPSFPHGPGGKKPMTEEEARANITRRLSCMDATMASPGTGCPIKEQETIKVTSSSSNSSTVSTPTPTMFGGGGGGGGCPVEKGQQQEYNVYAQPIDPKNNMPQEANQLPAPGQTKALSTDRVQSNIPKGGSSQETTTWTYPSPQMFYNALARKGKLDDTDETDIDSVVALHNNMNEKTWQKVLEWEAVLNPPTDNNNNNAPKLLKFTGRPTDLSPKAWFKHYILGHPLPFDRHDWTVLRSSSSLGGDHNNSSGGTTMRYVIDYYYDESRARQDAASSMPDLNDTNATPSLLIDVRPALDGPTQLWNRVVTMPLARNLGNTKYEPLPMLPTSSMKSQVSESVSVWQSIQLAAAGGGSKTRKEEEGEQSDEDHVFKNVPPLSDKEAKDLANNLGQALKECRQAQVAIDNLGNDDGDNSDDDSSYAKASLDLTICMGKILCPLQHSSLTQAARGDNEDKMEAALTSLNDCVLLKTTQHEMSRRKQKQRQQQQQQ